MATSARSGTPARASISQTRSIGETRNGGAPPVTNRGSDATWLETATVVRVGPSPSPPTDRSPMMRSDIEVGARFPDYELPDHTGEQRKLSDIQGTNMMVLHLARGGYDPKEHRFLRHFADAYAEFKAAYTRLAVITTDNQLDVNEFRDALGAEWPFLADPERTVQNDLEIQEYTDPHDPMVPHTSL